MFEFIDRLFGSAGAKVNPGPEEEDPRVTLSRGTDLLKGELAQAEESLRAVAAMKGDMERRRDEAGDAAERHARQAERAMGMGREDLARQALALRWEAERRREELERGVSEVDRQQTNLESARDELRQRLERMLARQVEMGARMTVAEAQIQLREATSAVREKGEVNQMQRSLDQRVITADKEAWSLPAAGDTDPGERLEREIRGLERDRRVQSELERLKREAIAAEEGAAEKSKGHD